MAPVRMPNACVEAIDNNGDDRELEKLWGELLESHDTLEDLHAGGSNYRGYFERTFGDFIAADVSQEGTEAVNEVAPQAQEDDVNEEPPQAEVDIPRVILKDLSFDLVAPTFTMAEKNAANVLGVSVTTLKVWCRLNDIPRWPFRKIRRIEILQSNIERFGGDEMFEEGITITVQKLEVEKRDLINNPHKSLERGTINLSKNMHRVAYRKRKHD